MKMKKDVDDIKSSTQAPTGVDRSNVEPPKMPSRKMHRGMPKGLVRKHKRGKRRARRGGRA